MKVFIQKFNQFEILIYRYIYIYINIQGILWIINAAIINACD